MSSFWPDGLNLVSAVASAVAAGASWWVAVCANRIAKEANAAADLANQAADAANRTAEAVARIERDRWHAELTPQFRVTATELGPGTRQASLRIELLGPAGLPRLDRVVLRIRDDGYERRPGVLLSQGQIDATIFGPYQFKPGIDGASPDGRTVTSRPLLLGEWDKFALARTRAPEWSVDDLWELQHGGQPIRLALECHAEGHRPWYVPHEVIVRDPNAPEPPPS